MMRIVRRPTAAQRWLAKASHRWSSIGHAGTTTSASSSSSSSSVPPWFSAWQEAKDTLRRAMGQSPATAQCEQGSTAVSTALSNSIAAMTRHGVTDRKFMWEVLCPMVVHSIDRISVCDAVDLLCHVHHHANYYIGATPSDEEKCTILSFDAAVVSVAETCAERLLIAARAAEAEATCEFDLVEVLMQMLGVLPALHSRSIRKFIEHCRLVLSVLVNVVPPWPSGAVAGATKIVSLIGSLSDADGAVNTTTAVEEIALPLWLEVRAAIAANTTELLELADEGEVLFTTETSRDDSTTELRRMMASALSDLLEFIAVSASLLANPITMNLRTKPLRNSESTHTIITPLPKEDEGSRKRNDDDESTSVRDALLKFLCSATPVAVDVMHNCSVDFFTIRMIHTILPSVAAVIDVVPSEQWSQRQKCKNGELDEVDAPTLGQQLHSLLYPAMANATALPSTDFADLVLTLARCYQLPTGGSFTSTHELLALSQEAGQRIAATNLKLDGQRLPTRQWGSTKDTTLTNLEDLVDRALDVEYGLCNTPTLSLDECAKLATGFAAQDFRDEPFWIKMCSFVVKFIEARSKRGGEHDNAQCLISEVERRAIGDICFGVHRCMQDERSKMELQASCEAAGLIRKRASADGVTGSSDNTQQLIQEL